MVLPEKVEKRNGRLVGFDEKRIRDAVFKAMISSNSYNPERLDKIVKEVLKTIEDVFDGTRTPKVEEIQDIIEVTLMRNGLYETAKGFILYRQKKAEIREEKKNVLHKDELDEIDKRFSLNSLRLLAARYLIKDEKGRPTESVRELFERVAVNIALAEVIYDEKVYDKNGNGIEFDETDFNRFNPVDLDGKYDLAGMRINRWHVDRFMVAYKEHALQGKMKVKLSKIFEMLEAHEFKKAEEAAKTYFDLMSRKDFLPNTPALVNSGRRLGMLSACFTLDVEDDLESIMKLAHDCAIIHKNGGGTGMNFSKLRPKGDIVASTTGVASGPVSFMKMIDAVSDVIKQGGVRRAANMGILEVWHPDIEEFITSKHEEGVLTNFNISVGINADFWEYLQSGEDYPLVHPRTKEPFRYINPKKLFDLIAQSAWATADPGVLFFDVINARNVMKSFRGEIKVTNPCGEEPLYPYESCNLASINLSNFVKKVGDVYEFDWERFHDVTRKVARALDNMITMNRYPIPEIDRATKQTRRIGVGVMGLANTLFKLKIRYNSEEGFMFMRKIMEHLTHFSYVESVEMAKERGKFPLFDKTDYTKGEMPIEGYYHRDEWTLDWDKLVEEIKANGLRNAMVTTCPPTGSISMIADTTNGIEPVFSLVFEKRVSVGSFFYANDVFEEELRKRNIYSEALMRKIAENYGSVQGIDDIPEDMRGIFVTSMDIHWADHIMAQAMMQRWITDSISKTINMPADVTVADVEQAYVLAHELGCKGVTIYRDESKKGQVLNVAADKKKKRFTAAISPFTMERIANLLEYKDYLKRFINLGEEKKEEQGSPPLEKAVIATVKTVEMAKEPLAPLVKGIGDGSDGICPACGGNAVVREAGCLTCKECGWSACTIS